MPQRLTPLEVSLLALDTAHTPAHVATVDIFDAGPDGLDYERLIALDPGSDRLRAAVPAARPRRPGPARRSPSGWTTRVSTSPSTSDGPRCLVRAPWSSCGSSSVGCWPAGWTGLGRCGRSTWSRGWKTTGSPWWRSPISAWWTASTHVDIGQVLLDARPQPELGTPESWRPLSEPSDVELVAGALWESANDPARAWQNVQGAATSALGDSRRGR